MVYRRLENSLDVAWHFHTKCLRWPELGLIDVQLNSPGSDLLCPECIKLEAKMIPPKNSSDD